MAPLFILLESISYAFRSISLGTRLYCNLFRGHLLLHLFTSLCLVPVLVLPVLVGRPLSFVVASILTRLSRLETIVAVLQSGVFCLLTSFYLNEVLRKKESLSSSSKLSASSVVLVLRALFWTFPNQKSVLHFFF